MLLRYFLPLFFSVASLSPSLRAQALVFSAVPDNSVSVRQDFRTSLGLFFTVNANQSLTISSLGYWDDNRDGTDAPITVSIFARNDTTTPLAQITFTGTTGTLAGNIVSNQNDFGPPPVGSGRDGQFRLSNISGAPLVLPAGQYALVAWGFNFNNQFLNSANDPPQYPVVDVTTFGNVLTFDGVAYNSHEAAYPTTLDGNTFDGSGARYAAATFSPDTISAIPEPSDYALMAGAAGLALGWWKRRRARMAG